MSALHKLTYGLFVISVNDGKKDNACIANTVMQVTSTPLRLCLVLNKENYTTEVLARTGVCNISILSERADFSTFERFGFQSGRTVDKFDGYNAVRRTENGCLITLDGTNAYFSMRVTEQSDLGTHIIFVGDVTESDDLSTAPSASYAYYHAHIKPKPKAASKTVWRCKICGYEYEGEELPPDFVCPLCKHGAEDFEKIESQNNNINNDSESEDIQMANLKGTKTEQNLWEAFAGESQARNKYTYFASQAKKEGYQQIGAIFEETANNEKEHAKIWFKLLHGGAVGTTAENLKAAAEGENGEWTDMYARMAREAKEEGFNDIAALFTMVANIEREHEERYLKLLKNVEDGTVFKKEEKVVWICRNCGHIVDSKNAPAMCPVCKHPEAYFELRVINY